MLNSVSLRRNVGRSALHLACVSIKPCSRLYTQLRKFSSRQRGRGDWACGAVPGFLLLKALTLSPLPSPLPLSLPSPLPLSPPPSLFPLFSSPFHFPCSPLAFHSSPPSFPSSLLSSISSSSLPPPLPLLSHSISPTRYVHGSIEWIHFCGSNQWVQSMDPFLFSFQTRQPVEKTETTTVGKSWRSIIVKWNSGIYWSGYSI